MEVENEFLPDHLAVGQHKETKLYHGLYYRNKPTPSGCNRFILSASTTQGYLTIELAAKAIENNFQNLPKITPESNHIINKPNPQ